MKNKFSIKYLKNILETAKNKNYIFMKMSDYISQDKDLNKKYFILRFDLDLEPKRLYPIVSLLKDLDIANTLFVRVSGPYNFLWYPNFEVIKYASNNNSEIGLHTNHVEWSNLLSEPTEEVFFSELELLRSKFMVSGVAPHRDLNYTFNSLPWIEENWENIKKKYNLKYHAYEQKFFDNFEYVNEGFNPHLSWRNKEPLDMINSNKNIYMLLHPHWWYQNHPFE